MAVSAALVSDWLTARSLARGLPPPIADRGGLRVDVGSDAEISRWVFAAPDAAIVAPRGDVDEGGAARFFRRRAEGVYDMADLARATGKMAGFVAALSAGE